MSNIYTDRDGFEWDKSCAFRCSNNVNKGSTNSTYCTAYSQYLTPSMNQNGSSSPFEGYYNSRPKNNDCPHYRPVGQP